MVDQSPSNKLIAKNSVYMSIRLVIVLIITLYTTRKTLEALGIVDYGIYNVVCGFVTMFSFLNTSLSNGIQRFFNYEYGKNGESGARKVFNSAIHIQVLLAFVIIIATEIIGIWYLHNKMVIPEDRLVAAEWIFRFSVASMALLILQAPFTAAVMAHEKMDFFSIISVIDAVLKLVLILLLSLFGVDHLVLYGFFIFLISFFDFTVYVIYTKKNFSEIKIIKTIDNNMLRNMLSFSGWNIFGSFAGMMREQGVNIVINLFFGPIVNAARGVAAQVNGALEGFAGNLLTPVRPQVIQSYAKTDYDRAFSLTFVVSKLSALFVVIFAIPLCFEIDFVLEVWLGDNVPEHTSNFVVLILGTTIVNVLMGGMATIVHASGEMKKYQLIGGLIKILPVPVSFVILKYIAIPELALISVFVFTFIGYIVGLFIIKQIINYSVKEYIISVLVPIIMVSLLTCICIVPWYNCIHNPLAQFLVVFPTGCLICTILSFYLGLNKQERSYLIMLINKILHKS